MGVERDEEGFEISPKFTWLNPGFEQTDEHPVVNVSWNDAVAFCEWLSRKEGKHLPPADRGGVGIRLPGRDDDELFHAATIPSCWPLSAIVADATGTAKATFPKLDFADRSAGRVCLHRAGWPISAQRVRRLRHARECLGVVCGSVRCRILPAFAGRGSKSGVGAADEPNVPGRVLAVWRSRVPISGTLWWRRAVSQDLRPGLPRRKSPA